MLKDPARLALMLGHFAMAARNRFTGAELRVSTASIAHVDATAAKRGRPE
jgi:hypothetical protein